MKRNWLSVIAIIAITLSVWGGLPVRQAKAAPTGVGLPILYYDFENNVTRTTFENLVEQVVNSGSAAITRVGNVTTITGVSGAGTFNGGGAAGQAATSSNWDSATTDPTTGATNYFQFVVNTTGFSQLTVAFDNQASGTGPARVGVLYSINGSTFTASTTTLIGNAAWSTASFDLTGISAIENQSSVTIRLYAFAGSAADRTGRSAFGTGGTFRIDNLTVLAKTVTASKTLLNMANIGLGIRSGTTYTPVFTDTTITGLGTVATVSNTLNLTGTLLINNGSGLVIPSGTTLSAFALTNNGTITHAQTVGGNASVSFITTGGYHGVDITNTVASSMGIVTVTVKGNQDCTTDLSTTTAPIRRCFNVTPATAQPATVKFWYTSAEANGNPETSANAYHWSSTNGWELLSGVSTSNGGGTDRWIQANVTAYSPFLLDDPAVGPTPFTSPLAVTLNDLNGTPTGVDGSAGLFLLGVGSVLIAALILSRKLAHITSN